MYLVLMVVGVLITAIGLVTIGFGIPINAFSLGNTLIITGATSVVGGLILIGLAAAVRQLKRIAEALAGGRPIPRPSQQQPAAALESNVPPTARLTPNQNRGPIPPQPNMPPRPAESRPPEPRQPEPRPDSRSMDPRAMEPRGMELRPAESRMPEPRFPGAPSIEPRAEPPRSEARGPLDWLRPKSKAPASDTVMMEVPDEAPLSPRTPSRLAFPPPPPPPSVVEPALEPKSWSPARDESRPVPRSERSEQIPRVSASPAPEVRAPEGRGSDAGLFDVVWPQTRTTPSGDESGKREPKLDAPLIPSPPTREEPASTKRGEPSASPASERPPSILKSGVIDGMAYTLYIDGSIEAELPQGTLKFASVDALRAHLEKNGN